MDGLVPGLVACRLDVWLGGLMARVSSNAGSGTGAVSCVDRAVSAMVSLVSVIEADPLKVVVGGVAGVSGVDGFASVRSVRARSVDALARAVGFDGAAVTVGGVMEAAPLRVVVGCVTGVDGIDGDAGFCSTPFQPISKPCQAR